MSLKHLVLKAITTIHKKLINKPSIIDFENMIKKILRTDIHK